MSLLSPFFDSREDTPVPVLPEHAAEVEHRNEVDRGANVGERLFWVSHRRVAFLHCGRKEIDGLPWRDWFEANRKEPAGVALELGCGQGLTLEALVRDGIAQIGEGIDLEASRFTAIQSSSLQLRAADSNRIQLEPDRYDLIYALGSFHHFEALEHIMEQVNNALTENGNFVLDEFVGPPRFQWTDLQLSITAWSCSP